MITLIIISSLFTALNALPQIKIVNGTDAYPGEIPYIVSVRDYGEHLCGGSIIDARHILTASHCTYGRSASTLSIQYGQTKLSNINVINVTKITMHPEYSHGYNYPNDVAVLELTSLIPFSNFVKPVALPKQNASTPGNKRVVLAGWGYPYSGAWQAMENLQRVDIMAFTDEDCERAHFGYGDRRIHVCAGLPQGGKGQCSGDSGGPLTFDGVQIGVVSWSVKPCARPDYPGVFARVANYVNWIRSVL